MRHSEDRNCNADEMALRRMALQIATQLPTDKSEALRILDLTRALVADFVFAERSQGQPQSAGLRVVGLNEPR